MIYDIGMPREKFDVCDSLVRDVTKRHNPRWLKMITSDVDRLSPENRDYVLSDPMALGVTFLNEERGEFDIWITPSYEYWDSAWTIDTILHELSHGYAGAMNHGQKFRRILGQCLHRYHNEVHPIMADFLVSRMVDRYSKDQWTTRKLEKEFTAKAALRA